MQGFEIKSPKYTGFGRLSCDFWGKGSKNGASFIGFLNYFISVFWLLLLSLSP